MSSNPLTTQITAIPESDVCESDLTSDSESDQSEDNERYAATDRHFDVDPKGLEAIEELILKNRFNKLEIIQKKRDSDVRRGAKVCHLVLTDKNDTIDEIIGFDNEYEFKNKSMLLEELKSKSKSSKRGKKSNKSDLQINIIPKTFEEFLDLILELNPILIEDKYSKVFFREETHNREIRFQDHESYVNAFIPFLIRELWSSLKQYRARDITTYPMTYEKRSENDIICEHIRHKTCDHSVFKFGQIVVLNYKLKSDNEPKEPESEPKEPQSEPKAAESEPKQLESEPKDLQNEQNMNKTVLEQNYFGIVKGVSTRIINKTSDEINNSLIKSQIESQSDENDLIVDSINIYCKDIDHSIESVSVMPLNCIQKYLLEARIVYELRADRFSIIWPQILKPIFDFGLSGLSISLDHRTDLYDVQRDCVQKAYDECVLPPGNGFSSFVAINGKPKTGKTEVLIETVSQLIKLAEEKIQKVLIIADGFCQLNIEALKKNEIKVYHIDSEDKCLSHTKLQFKKLIRSMNKDCLFDDIDHKHQSYDNCLKFYNEDIEFEELSIIDRYVKEKIDYRVMEKLIKETQVIIGSISSIMNSELFNFIYNSNEVNNISCALVDNAHFLTETEILTLLYAGVKAFALFGDNLKNAISYERCESFFQRYVRVYNQNYHQKGSINYSVIHLKDSIQDLERLKNNSRNKKNDPRFQRNKNFNEYKKTSNYGSTYFKRNNRFQDSKPFKTENDNFSNNYYKREGEANQRSNQRFPPTGPPIQDNKPLPTNLMTDGITSQFAYGNRDSYTNRADNYNDSMDNIFNPSGSSTNAEQRFVSNPNSHQNYNLF